MKVQTGQAPLAALMLRFSERPPGASLCIRCGQLAQFSFSGGRLVDQSCGCNRVAGTGAGTSELSVGKGDAPPACAATRRAADIDP